MTGLRHVLPALTVADPVDVRAADSVFTGNVSWHPITPRQQFANPSYIHLSQPRRCAVLSAPRACLNISRGPSAILWTVGAIIIYAVNAVANGPVSHIGPKIKERFAPSFANDYSATAVAVPCGAFWIRAPVFHAKPSLIQRGARHPVRSGFLPAQASAGPCVPDSQTLAGSQHFDAAVTAAAPPQSAGSLLRNNEQPAEALAEQVDGLAHIDLRNIAHGYPVSS